MSVVIDVEDLSKAFPIYKRPSDVIKDFVFSGRKSNLFWALRNVSFQIREGQRVGIIGANGSGKTTLLRILTGNLTPTSGKVDVHGRISAMLSLASSMSLEDTGYNNIKFNLLLNGCDPKKIPGLVDEIIEFTELGPFIYNPVRTYSSGMNAKLTFGITTAMEPDLLVVDEVLSVGDAYFVGKAMKRMTELANRGRALVFVSHDTSAVLRLCDTCVWMDDGEIREMGPSQEVVAHYEENWRRLEDLSIRSGAARRNQEASNGLVEGDFKHSDGMKVRLIGSSTNASDFQDTFYVRSVEILSEKGSQNLDLRRSDMGSGSYVDLREGQWGRCFRFGGVETRMLGVHPGRLRGGIVWLRDFAENQALRLKVRYRRILGKESLQLQVPNYQTQTWETLLPANSFTDRFGWTTSEFEIKNQKEQQVNNKRSLRRSGTSPVEILDTRIVSDRPIHSVTELEKFHVEVDLAVWEVVPDFDVCLKVTKADGTYVFWMSSGESGQHFRSIPVGTHKVRFSFDPNPFGSGEYVFSTVVGSGWDPEKNYPHSDVYDRSFAWGNLLVRRQFQPIDFGIVNLKVPVELTRQRGADWL